MPLPSIGGVALTQQGLLWRPLALLVLAGLGALARFYSRATSRCALSPAHRLFPMAAPSGGIILIGAWVALVVAAIATAVRS